MYVSDSDVFDIRSATTLFYMALSLTSNSTGGASMTIAFEPAKQLVLKVAKAASGFTREHVQPSAKATTDGFTVTVHVRLKGKGRPLPTT